MDANLPSFLALGAVALLATAATMPAITYFSGPTDISSLSDPRRMRLRSSTALGSVSMLVGLLCAWIAGWFAGLFIDSAEHWWILIATCLAWATGLLEESSRAPRWLGVVFPLVPGLALAYGGIGIESLPIPFIEPVGIPAELAPLVNSIWILCVTTALRGIAGFNELVAGIVGIGTAGLLLFGVRLEELSVVKSRTSGLLASVVLVGIVVGYMAWSIYPARIYMGSAGIRLFGAMTATATIAVAGEAAAPAGGQAFFFYAPVFVPAAILVAPALDAGLAYRARSKRGVPASLPSFQHLHRRLARLGYGQRRAVGLLWAWTALLTSIALYPAYNFGRGQGLVAPATIAGVLLLVILLLPRREPVSASGSGAASQVVGGDGYGPAIANRVGHAMVSNRVRRYAIRVDVGPSADLETLARVLSDLSSLTVPAYAWAHNEQVIGRGAEGGHEGAIGLATRVSQSGDPPVRVHQVTYRNPIELVVAGAGAVSALAALLGALKYWRPGLERVRAETLKTTAEAKKLEAEARREIAAAERESSLRTSCTSSYSHPGTRFSPRPRL